jgi:hypothetical protein
VVFNVVGTQHEWATTVMRNAYALVNNVHRVSLPRADRGGHHERSRDSPRRGVR